MLSMTHHELNNCANLSNIIDIMNSLTEVIYAPTAEEE